MLVILVAMQFFGFVYTNMKIIPQAWYIPLDLTFSWFAITVLVFAMLYFVNDRIVYNKTASFIADISYPLYLCHSYIGYSLIGVILYMGLLPKSVAMFIPIPVAIFVAYLVHVRVELKNNDMAKRFSSFLNKRVSEQ